jgi:quercetin dioxygenase-like cupin family protein
VLHAAESEQENSLATSGTEEEDEMRQMILTLFMMIAVGVFAITAGQEVNAQTRGVQVITQFKAEVAGVEGKKWNVSTVELAPGAVDARHVHPGAELVYVLEGAGFLEVDGNSPVALKPGTTVALTPHHMHVLKNTSQTKRLKVLVVLPLENGDGQQQKATDQNQSTPLGLIF